jgi:hypothetical protein
MHVSAARRGEKHSSRPGLSRKMTAMTTKTYYQLSLTLPILIPLLLMIVSPQNNLSNPITFILSGSLEYGGIPYVVLAFCLFVWMRDKTTDETRNGILCSPLLMPIALLLCETVQYLVMRWTDGDHVTDFGGEWPILSFFAVVVGYCYVGIVSFILWTLKEWNWVHDQD